MPDSSTLPLTSATATHREFQVYTERSLERIAPLARLDADQRFAMQVVAAVLPFRVNQYVIDELIDWERVPDDPMFQLTFPQPGMLHPEAYSRMAALLAGNPQPGEVRTLADELRADLNPHPAGQQTLNVPHIDGRALEGMQHKYRETVLFFPSQGQVCHAYCTFCFRWAQFVGDKALRFASAETDQLRQYLAAHPEVTDLLVTGGDPMVMKTRNLRAYLETMLDPALEHVRTVRIGTKALTYWPYRFVTDPDADDLLRLLERLVKAGKQVAIMAHINHWRELEPAIVAEAVRRVRDTGAVIRAQAPLLAHINDDAAVWARLWQKEVELGIYPYYMFVERDTGAKRYFEVPLTDAWRIYQGAMQQVSGLARTARGPSMSTAPGKVEVQGITEIGGEKVFALRFLQARDPDWVNRPFFARFDPHATWLDDLKPAFGEDEFFFAEGYRRMLATDRQRLN
ncbi:MAG: lysine 2,3-aminomutase [Gammaproteobacteria bacterium]|nr:lysine 2,3-aminomutase [Gammaproteobacteria bacterium]